MRARTDRPPTSRTAVACADAQHHALGGGLRQSRTFLNTAHYANRRRRARSCCRDGRRHRRRGSAGAALCSHSSRRPPALASPILSTAPPAPAACAGGLSPGAVSRADGAVRVSAGAVSRVARAVIAPSARAIASTVLLRNVRRQCCSRCGRGVEQRLPRRRKLSVAAPAHRLDEKKVPGEEKVPGTNAVRLSHNPAPLLRLLHLRDKRPPVRMVVLKSPTNRRPRMAAHLLGDSGAAAPRAAGGDLPIAGRRRATVSRRADTPGGTGCSRRWSRCGCSCCRCCTATPRSRTCGSSPGCDFAPGSYCEARHAAAAGGRSLGL